MITRNVSPVDLLKYLVVKDVQFNVLQINLYSYIEKKELFVMNALLIVDLVNMNLKNAQVAQNINYSKIIDVLMIVN
jgi:hypothetical protein